MGDFVMPKRMRTSHSGEAARAAPVREQEPDTPKFEGPHRKRKSDGAASQWLLIYPLRPSAETNNVSDPSEQ